MQTPDVASCKRKRSRPQTVWASQHTERSPNTVIEASACGSPNVPTSRRLCSADAVTVGNGSRCWISSASPNRPRSMAAARKARTSGAESTRARGPDRRPVTCGAARLLNGCQDQLRHTAGIVVTTPCLSWWLSRSPISLLVNSWRTQESVRELGAKRLSPPVNSVR